jgi:hypothetical protein
MQGTGKTRRFQFFFSFEIWWIWGVFSQVGRSLLFVPKWQNFAKNKQILRFMISDFIFDKICCFFNPKMGIFFGNFCFYSVNLIKFAIFWAKIWISQKEKKRKKKALIIDQQ